MIITLHFLVLIIHHDPQMTKARLQRENNMRYTSLWLLVCTFGSFKSFPEIAYLLPKPRRIIWDAIRPQY